MKKITELPNVVAIVGSRQFAKQERIANVINALTEGTIVVSGGAPAGVDFYVKQFIDGKGPYGQMYKKHVFYKGIDVENFEWQAFGKRAGHLRNADLVAYVKRRNGVVLVFTHPSNLTPGSKNVIDTCKKEHVKYFHMLQSVASDELIQPCPYCSERGCNACDSWSEIKQGWRPV